MITRTRRPFLAALGTVLALSVAPAALVAAPTPPATAAAAIEWRLDLDENFNGSSVNRSVWSVRNYSAAGNDGSMAMARNVSVGDGVVRLKAKREQVGSRKYTTGYLHTIGTYTMPDYFRAEVRAKVPWQQGLWPAPLWFRPGNGTGEIDLIETFGFQKGNPMIHHTIHTEYGSNKQKAKFLRSYASLGKGSAWAWHTYTVEKVPGKITMWTDGVETARFTSGDPSWYDRYYEAGQRWSMRMNLQVGGRYAQEPDSTTRWDASNSTMQVDYVRTWVPR